MFHKHNIVSGLAQQETVLLLRYVYTLCAEPASDWRVYNLMSFP